MSDSNRGKSRELIEAAGSELAAVGEPCATPLEEAALDELEKEVERHERNLASERQALEGDVRRLELALESRRDRISRAEERVRVARLVLEGARSALIPAGAEDPGSERSEREQSPGS